MLFDDLTYSGSEFQRVGTATEKARVAAWVLNLWTGNKWKSDGRSFLILGARESMENRYDSSPEERVYMEWYRIWKWCEIEDGASEEISGVAQNEKTEETVWQP